MDVLRDLTSVPIPALRVLALLTVNAVGAPAPLPTELRDEVLDSAQIGTLLVRHGDHDDCPSDCSPVSL